MKIEEEILPKEFRSGCQKTAVNFLFISLRMNETHARFFKRHEDCAPRQFNPLILHGKHPKPLSASIIHIYKERAAR